MSKPHEENLRPRTGDAPPIRVLLVDDHKLIRSALSTLLQEEPDLEVIGEAGSGDTALELSRRLQPDVVLMDITMPGMNGIAATHLISNEMPDVHVIVLSHHPQADLESAMREAGAAACLNKSVDLPELLATIRTVAEKASPRAGARGLGKSS